MEKPSQITQNNTDTSITTINQTNSSSTIANSMDANSINNKGKKGTFDRDDYWSPIKAEFLKKPADNKKRKSESLNDAENNTSNNANENPSVNTEEVKKDADLNELKTETKAPQKSFPQSKKAKKRERKKMLEENGRICAQILEGEKCEYGDKCRYSHDLQAFLKNKPTDLLPECPLFMRYGKCPFGVKCRFGSGHLKDGSNVTKETVIPRNIPLNSLSKDLQKLLWKGEKEFPKAEPIIKELTKTGNTKREGPTIDSKPHPREVKPLDIKGKLVLAPLTTIGNLPYRVICKKLGADVTCGEMAVATHLLSGQKSEWALLKRDPSENFFGIQLAGSHVDSLTRCVEVLNEEISFDYIDLNCGCPIDVIYNRGMGSALLEKTPRLEGLVRGMHSVCDKPVTIKIRTGRDIHSPTAHNTIVPYAHLWGASAITIHGRSREQRYTKEADWSFIANCKKLTSLPVIGNGDLYSWQEAQQRIDTTGVDSLMLARGAIIKPWLFTEIKEHRDWDISANERLDLIKQFCHLGLDHWGSDDKGVNTTREFLLNWMAFTHRYVPVGLLETLPSKLNHRPPPFVGRSQLETLLASPTVSDWVTVSEMFLGKSPEGFTFVPKHKSPAYKDDASSNTNQVEG